jgi:hypothetical protein
VDAELVRSAGDQVQLEQRPVAEVLLHAVDGRRRPAVRHDRHANAVTRIAADGRLDATNLGGWRAGDQGEIGLLDAPLLELAHQRLLGTVVARHHDQAARVAVQPVDDARPVDAADRAVCLCPASSQQRVDQRAAGVDRAPDA